MNKQLRTMIIAGVAVLALVGVLLVLLLMPQATGGGTENSSSAVTSNSTVSTPTITLNDKTTDADGKTVSAPVKKATIALNKVVEADETAEESADADTAPQRYAEEIALTLSEEGYLTVDAYAELPVNTAKASVLRMNLATVTATREIAMQAGTTAADFGFDEPQAQVEVTYHDDSTYAFEIGDKAPMGLGYYLRETGGEKIYLVSASYAECILQEGRHYVSLYMYTAPSVSADATNDTVTVQSMKLSGALRTRSFKVRELVNSDPAYIMGSYIMVEPFAMRQVNDTTLSTMASSMTSLIATEVVAVYPTAAQKSEYGFDAPYSVADLYVAVRQADDGSDEDAETVYYNTRHPVVTLGSKTADGDYYAMVTVDGEEMPVIYRVTADMVPWAETQYTDILGTLLFMRNIVNVETVVVTIDGKSTTFALEHFPEEEDNDDKLKVTVDGETYDTQNFRRLYAVLMAVNRNGEADAAPTGEPKMIIRINPNDGSPSVEARFYKYNANNYLCELDDGDRYLVTNASLTTTIQRVEAFLAGEELPSF